MMSKSIKITTLTWQAFVKLHLCPHGTKSSASLHHLWCANIGRGPAQEKTSPLACTIPRRFVVPWWLHRY